MTQPIRIYLDPGHGEGTRGRYDPGAIGPTGLRENDVTFDIAKRLGHLLREKGFQTLGATLAAAKDDENLYEAINAANAAKVDLYFSVHCNASVKPQAHGVEAWYGGKAVSRQVAEAIMQRIGAQLAGGQGQWIGRKRYPLYNRGAKQGNYAVLQRTTMPAVLVEILFISNSQEEAWLRDRYVRQQFAQAIADGIADVFTKGA